MAYHPHAQLPDIDDPAVSLWRYVDLYRYLDLLQSAELHLTRADQMEDRWEGSYSAVNVAARPTVYAENWEAMSQQSGLLYRFGRTHIYLNCWYMGAHESYAMWKLYGSAGKGVAIKTTTGRLKGSMTVTKGQDVSGSQVRYVDYAETFIPEGNLFFPLMHKRLSFDHEHEYRLLTLWSPKVLETDEHDTAVRTEPDLPPRFLREGVDLRQLIQEVYVSPDAPDWVARTVTDVTHLYMPDVDVRHSDLAADPVY